MILRAILTCCCVLFATTASALDLELTQGINTALPIGITPFQGEMNRAMSDVIDHDLRLSGQFKCIPTSPQSTLANWRALGADSVVQGNVQSLGGGRYAVQFKLLDTTTGGRTLLSDTFQVSQSALRPLAHHISDLVYEKLTGQRGVFSTRIAYILVRHQGEQTRYSLEVGDADGYNPQALLVSSEPIMSPSWSPDGQYIAYVSFEKRRAQIFTVRVADGHRQLITSFNGINGAPAWSKDGRQLAVVLSKGGTPKIYTVDLSDGHIKQLTFGGAIDTEPRFLPNGQGLIFTSDRGGSPQVYQLTFADGQIKRLTFDGRYNARATYTPDQKYLVLLHREEDKRFHIGVQEEGNQHITSLTYEALDESPSVAPNGRLIIYATRAGNLGVLGLVSIDGKIRMRMPGREGDIQEPAWSPYV